jgi:broad specificity phosphatase PhoE
MATRDLILVRHGVTDWNEAGRLMGRLPIGLNERGRAQAAGLAHVLAEIPLRAVFASPQERAHETAAAIATPHGLSPQPEPALAEVWLGRWQGKRFADLRDDPDVIRFLADPLHICDAIEPAADVRARVVALVERLRAPDEPQGAVALVSHGDPLRILVTHLLGLELGAYRRFAIDPASVTLARFEPYGPRILTLNWSPNGPAALPLTP